MTHTIRFSKQANSYLKRLDPTTRRRVLTRLDEVAVDPYGLASKALFGTPMRSARVGDYRILFEVDDVALEILVGTIGPRGQVYRIL